MLASGFQERSLGNSRETRENVSDPSQRPSPGLANSCSGASCARHFHRPIVAWRYQARSQGPRAKIKGDREARMWIAVCRCGVSSVVRRPSRNAPLLSFMRHVYPVVRSLYLGGHVHGTPHPRVQRGRAESRRYVRITRTHAHATPTPFFTPLNRA